MSFELTGTLIEKFDTQQVSDKFSKREFVIEKRENTGNYEFVDQIKFQLTQDKCDLINNFNTGEDVKVSFNIRGRKWEKADKVSYFTNLEAWKIERNDASAQANDSAPPPPEDDYIGLGPEDTGLPF